MQYTWHDTLIPKSPVNTFVTTAPLKAHPHTQKLVSIIHAQQIHSNTYTWVDATTCAPVEQTDALLTTDPQIALVIMTADCLPLLIYEPTYQVIAAIHAGRRGTQADITKRTCAAIASYCPTPATPHIWFGPAICKDCYQIDQERDIHYDLLTENTKQIDAVFPTYTAHHSNACTLCDHHRWYSYRGGDRCKHIYSGIWLTK